MNLLTEKITDPAKIQQLIPQKPPMVMIDALLYYDATKVISGFTILENNLFVQNAEFTEPGLIEHMAQTVAMYTGYHFYINNVQAPEGYIGAIKGVEIIKLPKVGDQLETEVIILEEIMGISLTKGTTRLNGEIIMTAQMKTVVKKETE